MVCYKDWAPTALDPVGLHLPEQQDWLVLPVMRTRDSGPLDLSNFAVALETFGGESDTVEVHRFGHWGPGWFEIVIAHPSRESEVRRLEEALNDYPVLDDSDYSRREWDDFCDGWNEYGCADFIEAWQQHLHFSDGVLEKLEDADKEILRRFYCDVASEPYITESSGVAISADRTAERLNHAHLVRALYALDQPDASEIGSWVTATTALLELDARILYQSEDCFMLLRAPVIITSRLMAGLQIGEDYLSIGYDDDESWDGRCSYLVYLDTADGRAFKIRDLRSGVGGGTLQEGLESLLSFLGAAAESYAYSQRTGRSGENELFEPAVTEWAYQHSDEISSAQSWLEEGETLKIEEERVSW